MAEMHLQYCIVASKSSINIKRQAIAEASRYSVT